MIISLLRKEAKDKLKGKWKKAILFMLVFYITSLVISYIRDLIITKTVYGLIATIFSIIITLSINYGLIASFVRLKRDEKVNCLHFIYFAGRDIEKLWKTLGKLLIRLIWYIIGFILAIYLVITECISLYYGYGVRLSFFVEIICLIVITIFFVKQILYYSLNNYILFDNNKSKAKEILNESKRLMTNHRWDFIKMNISFAGWIILGIAVSSIIILVLYNFVNIHHYGLIYISYIPLIFITPYMYTTTICFYDNLLYNNPKPKDDEIKNIKTSKNKKKRK